MALFEDDPKASNPPDAADDPIASLFQGSRAMPAPKIAEAPSEAEITRWHAATRSSLFEESVPDPSPPPPAGSAKAAYVPPLAPEAARKPPAIAAPEPPPAAAPAVTAEALLAPAAPPVATAAAEAAPRKRRVATGPKKRVLIATGIAAALSVGAAAAVLQLIPNPFAAPRDPASQASGSIAHLDPPVRPAPVVPPKPAAAAPAVAAAVAPAPPAVGAAPAPHFAKPEPAKPEVIAPAPAPAATVAVAKVEAAKAEPVKAEPVKAAPAAVAPAAAHAEAADDAPSPAEAENQKLIFAANKLLADDDAKGAEALMRQALTADPGDHHAMEVLVRALIDQDRGAEAVPYARKMVKRRSKRVPYRLLLGDALLMTGDEAGARREWKAALEIDPKDRQVRLRLGL